MKPESNSFMQERVSIKAGPNTLLQELKDRGISLKTPCNGKGTCGKCRIRLLSGTLTEAGVEEKKLLGEAALKEGIRLACMAKAVSDCQIQAIGKETAREEEDALILTGGHLPAFEKSEGKSGFGAAIDIGTTTVVCSLVDMASGRILADSSMVNSQKSFGHDVLTRISYELEDPENGVRKLQESIISCINELLQDCAVKADIKRNQIQEIAVAANSTMMHMLLGISAVSLGKYPYKPVFTQAKTIEASFIGIQAAENALIYCLPSVSAYIGADIVAGVRVCEMDKRGSALFIDIGTNGEIVLAHDGRLLCCSCAAGPALEGMNIRNGMRASQGAIEAVEIHESLEYQSESAQSEFPQSESSQGKSVQSSSALGESGKIESIPIESLQPESLCEPQKQRISLKVIGENAASHSSKVTDSLPPQGLCGSGILSVMKELVRHGFLKKNGAFIKPETLSAGDWRKEYLVSDGKKRAFLLHENPEILITQDDVRQVQLAKGAILSGFTALLEKAEISMEELDEVLVAGQFGAHLPADSLTGCGILPKAVEDRIRYMGNTSKNGAFMALLSESVRSEMELLAGKMEYVELADGEQYDRLLAKCMQF